MNKSNALLAILDKTYGYKGKNSSTFKPIKKYFNQETGEMVTVIEYRTKKPGEVVIKTANNKQSRRKTNMLQALIQQMNSKK